MQASLQDYEGALEDAEQVRMCEAGCRLVSPCGASGHGAGSACWRWRHRMLMCRPSHMTGFMIQVVKIKADWPKGYSRLGGALSGLQRWDEAVSAYQKGGQTR